MTGTVTTGNAPAISFNRVEYAQKSFLNPPELLTALKQAGLLQD